MARTRRTLVATEAVVEAAPQVGAADVMVVVDEAEDEAMEAEAKSVERTGERKWDASCVMQKLIHCHLTWISSTAATG